MITLRQIGRIIHIENQVDDKLTNVISKKLSYMKQNARFLSNPIFGLVNLYNRKKQIFPAGLWTKVKLILDSWKKQTGEDYTLIDNGKKLNINIPSKFSDNELRDYQKEAVLAVLNNRGGIIHLPTSAGKSRVAIEILRHQDGKKLVLVPTRDLVTQWKKQVKCLGIDVETYQMMYRHLERLEQYDWVCGDEIHHIAAKTLYKVGMYCKNAIMFGVSATIKRDDGEDMKMNAVMGDVVYTIPIQELVAKGYLVQAKVYLVDVVPVDLTPFDEYHDIVKSNIVEHKSRNSKIIEIALKECEKGTTIIMIDLIEHGNKLLEMLKGCKKKVVYVNGQSKDRDEIFKKAIADHYDIIIASRVYGEGVSISNLKTMILAGGGKGTTKIVQQVGRMLRQYKGKDKANIYDFKDGSKILKGHFNKRLKIYKDHGFEIEEAETQSI
jgi:superfamily II DNA or RNA helicase